MKEVKLFCKKTEEIQIVDSSMVEMAIKVWVKYHNEKNRHNRITKRDIIVIPD